MRKLIAREEAEKILEPYYESLVTSIDEGFDDFLRISEFKDDLGVFATFKQRTRACIVHDQVTARIKSKLMNFDGVKCDEWSKIFGIKIGDSLFIRFKKLDNHFSPSNVQTKQNDLFRKQMSIPGFPDSPTFLYAGYIPDSAWSRLNGIYIACWAGDHVNWVIDAGKYSSEQLGLNFRSTEPQPMELDKDKQRVILKKKA